MKKLLALALTLVVIFSLVACGEQTTSNPASESTNSADIVHLSMGTSSIGGTAYGMGGGWAKIMNDNITGVDIAVQVTGGPQTNLQLIEQRDAELGLITAWQAGVAWNGEDWAEGKEYRRARTICPLWNSHLYIITLEGSPINGLADFADKNIAGGSPGSSSDMCGRAILELLGIEPRQFNSLTADAQLNGLKDGTLDALFIVNGTPSPAVMDLQTTHNIKYLRYTADEETKIMEAFPYWSMGVIPAGTYNDLDQDLTAVALWQFCLGDKDLPEELVYEMTKNTFEHNDELVAVNQSAKDALAENIVYATTPLHPGAYKYYQEIGIDIPDKLKPIE